MPYHWERVLNDLVYGDASRLSVGRTGQAGTPIGERKGSGDSAAPPAASDLRTEARAGTALVVGRETNAGRTGDEAESQDGTHDESSRACHELSHFWLIIVQYGSNLIALSSYTQGLSGRIDEIEPH